MSIRVESIYFIVCDYCGVEYHDPTVRSAMEARIKAGAQGWQFRAGSRSPGKGGQRHWDTCGKCAS